MISFNILFNFFTRVVSSYVYKYLRFSITILGNIHLLNLENTRKSFSLLEFSHLNNPKYKETRLETRE